MYRYLIRKNPYIILYIVLAPLSALCSIACAGALAAAVDYASEGSLEEIWKYIVFFAGYILLDLFVDMASGVAQAWLTRRTMTALQKDTYHKLSRMCSIHFFMRNTADYLSNLTADTGTLRSSYFGILLELYMDFLRCGIAIAVLAWISPILGGFVLVNALLQTIIPILYSKPLERAGADFSDAQERHMAVLKENLNAFLTAKIFHVEDRLERNFSNALEHMEGRRQKLSILKLWSSDLSFVFSRVTHLGTFLLGAVLTLRGTISMAEVVAASQLIVYISSPIYSLNANLADLRTAKVPSKKLRSILGEQEDLGGATQMEYPSGRLQVRDLHFGYSGDREILRGISYDFQPGGKYLIVGASGCGKSTFLNLMAGLRDDYIGAITLGGTELRQLSRASLAKSMCVLNQEPFLFDDTLYNNVCLYEKMDETAVLDALRRVELGALLEKLPQGIHTPMGENAAAMSGGEKQRVVIARALVRKPSLLLLDESTSHLDPTTAAGIEQLVLGLEGVTVLLVSHNATEIAKELADEILEMENGELHKIA